MEPIQLTFASKNRHPLFPEERACREALQVLGRIAGKYVVLFAAVDDHFHIVLYCDDGAETGRLAQALHCALKPLVATELASAHVSDVKDRGHMEGLVRYCLEQPLHHGLSLHPAVTTGSCFPDLVGARRIPGLKIQLTKALPRYALRDAYPIVGLPPRRIDPVSDLEVREAGAHRLVGACLSAALGLAPTGRDAASVLARRAACTLAAETGMSVDEVAFALGITDGAVRRVAQRPAPASLATAARVWLSLENAVSQAADAAAIESLAAAYRARRAGSARAAG
jgi:hypothetical protein